MTTITLTDAAIVHIKKLLEKNPKSVGFRLSVKKTGCSGYAYVPEIIEAVNSSDVHLIQDELNLYVDRGSESFFKALVVDYITDMSSGIKQEKLVFINPDEKNRCGCGESFTIE